MSSEPEEELAAGYALHALEPEELRQFEAHLAGCARCRARVAAFADTAAELAFSLPAASAPSGAVRAALLDRIATEPQVSPLRRPRPRAAPRLLAVAASIVALVAVGLAVEHGRRGEAERDRLLGCVRQAQCAAFPISAVESGQRRGTVVVRGDSVWLLLDAVPRNDPVRTRYVLWQVPRTGDPVAMGGFDVTRRAAVTSAFGMRVGAAETKALAVTLEPGRDVPSAPRGDRVLVAPLPS